MHLVGICAVVPDFLCLAGIGEWGCRGLADCASLIRRATLLKRMRVGTIIAAGLAACLAAGEAEAVTEGAAGGAALGPAANPAIADTLHRLNPQLVRALVHVFATLPESDPAFIAARARAGEIGAAIGLSGAAVEGLLRVLGDAPVAVEPVGEKLIQIAEAYDVAHARLVAVAADDPAAREAADAEAALEQGQ